MGVTPVHNLTVWICSGIGKGVKTAIVEKKIDLQLHDLIREFLLNLW